MLSNSENHNRADPHWWIQAFPLRLPPNNPQQNLKKIQIVSSSVVSVLLLLVILILVKGRSKDGVFGGHV